MKPESFLDGKVTLLRGDCLELLPTLAENSIDSCVTDPPYGIQFMSRGWDQDVPGVAYWTEVFRVLKPGAHLLAFSGTRTYHHLATAIEDAGFEIRDQIGWCYGSGFPKSLDISKAIDRARQDNADWKRVGKWLREQREARGLKQKQVAALWPSITGGLTGCVANWELGFSCPKLDQWIQLKEFIGFGEEMDAEVWRLNGRKGTPGEAWQTAEIVGIKQNAMSDWRADENGLTANFVDREIKAPNSEAAIQWQGWGTALKPAWEPIVLARKPLSESSIASNVLKHGTGAINIDGCRIGTEVETWPKSRSYAPGQIQPGGKGETMATGPMPNGRWPANLIHDGSEEVLEGFPDTGVSAGGCTPFVSGRIGYGGKADGSNLGSNAGGLGDSGSAASTTESTQTGGSALSAVVASPLHENGGKTSRKKTHARAAANGSSQCHQPSADIARSNAEPLPLEKIVQNVLSAASLCLSCGTDIARAIAEARQGVPPDKSLTTLSIATYKKTILTRCLASHVAHRENTDTILTIPSLTTLFGSVFHAIGAHTNSERVGSEANTKPALSRYWYTSKADADDRLGSRHPTVKPLDLIQYLVRLVTPKGGVVLDPFSGTGTTGEAGFREGMAAVLIEREPEYQADIVKRMGLCLAGPDERRAASVKQVGLEGTPLFGGAG